MSFQLHGHKVHSSSKDTQLLTVSFFLEKIVDHDPELLTLTQGHQGKWNKKSCVSFEEECTIGTHILIIKSDEEIQNIMYISHKYIIFISSLNYWLKYGQNNKL